MKEVDTIDRSQAAAIAKIAAAFISIGVPADAVAAIGAGTSVSDFALTVIGDLIDALEDGAIDPDVAATFEPARVG